MKKFNELVEERNLISSNLQQINNKIEEKQKEFEAELDKHKNLTPKERRLEFLNNEIIKNIDTEIAKLELEKDKLETFLKYSKHNMYISISCSNIDKIIEIINKYEGKRAGEKTSEKLRNELNKIEEDLRFYIDERKIEIVHDKFFTYSNKIVIYTKFDSPIIDNDNKYCKIENESLQICDDVFIENFEEFYNQSQNELKEIENLEKELREKTKLYNEKCVSRFEHRKIVK